MSRRRRGRRENPNCLAPQPGDVIALNNGRTAALQRAYRDGNADGLGALRVAHGSRADSDLGAMGFSLFFGLAVLIALAGLKSYRFDRNDGGDEDSPGFTTYQLNLVLRSAVAPRQNIAMTGALRETQFRGRALAECLGVPLIDLIRVTKNDR
jgi:hypothetical protein